MIWILPSYAALIAVSVFTGRSVHFSESRPSSVKHCRMPESAVPAKKLHFCRIAIIVCAVLFIVLGAMNGGARDVLIKAINICTECIGLG